MVIHSTLTGADNHNPRMVSPDPLVIADNVTNVILWEDTSGNDYLAISTTSGNRSISFGSTVTNPSYSCLGSGEVLASTFSLPKLTGSPTTTTLEERGKLYTKDVTVAPSGPTVLELFYASDALAEIQLTSNGSAAGGGTLDDAYNFGGAAAGRQIDVTPGSPVFLDTTTGGAGGSASPALKLNGSIEFSGTTVVIGGSNGAAVGIDNTVVGNNAQSVGEKNVVIGKSASSLHASGNSVAIGHFASSMHQYSVALGDRALTSADNQIVIGSTVAGLYVNELLLGGGDSQTSTVRTTTFRTTNSSASSHGRGWNLHVTAGRGMGNGAGGDIMLRTSAPGSSGLQSAFDAVGVDPTTGNASANGEVLLASNILTDPRRFSSFSGSVSSTNTATHEIVDLAGYSLGADQAGWLKVQLMVRSNNPSNSPQSRSSFFELATTFTLVSGTLTLGSTEKSIPRIDVGAQTLSDADLTATSSTKLNVGWTATGSDDFDVVWSAEWLFGPIS